MLRLFYSEVTNGQHHTLASLSSALQWFRQILVQFTDKKEQKKSQTIRHCNVFLLINSHRGEDFDQFDANGFNSNHVFPYVSHTGIR